MNDFQLKVTHKIPSKQTNKPLHTQQRRSSRSHRASLAFPAGCPTPPTTFHPGLELSPGHHRLLADNATFRVSQSLPGVLHSHPSTPGGTFCSHPISHPPPRSPRDSKHKAALSAPPAGLAPPGCWGKANFPGVRVGGRAPSGLTAG